MDHRIRSFGSRVNSTEGHWRQPYYSVADHVLTMAGASNGPGGVHPRDEASRLPGLDALKAEDARQMLFAGRVGRSAEDEPLAGDLRNRSERRAARRGSVTAKSPFRN